MNEAPKKIYVRATDKTVMSIRPSDADGHDVKYIRADIVKEMAEALEGVFTWVDSKCPCIGKTDEEIPICPLCGASEENGEACKAVEQSIPTQLLKSIKSSIAKYKGETQ